MKTPVKVLFVSGSDDLIPTAIEHLQALYPEIPIKVVSEFPPGGDIPWIPFHMNRTFQENLDLCRASLQGHEIRLSAVILQPRMPYWKMRAVGLALSPWNFLAFNENFGHFMLRPRSAGTMLRHFVWRARNFVVWELSPGGFTYTLLWRVRHPGGFRRPLLTLMAGVAGRLVAALKRSAQSEPPGPVDAALHSGISVVIPSRNGKELLERALPEVVRQIAACGGEVIVSDNGSGDGTVAWLREAYPEVEIVHRDRKSVV